MSDALLQIKGLKVSVGEKEILHGIDLSIGKNETHVLMGPNGAGKSTLGHAIMGNPKYEINEGTATFKGEELLDEAPDKRAKMGIFLSFQNPIEIPGVTLSSFIRSSMDQKREKRIRLWEYRKELEKMLKVLDMDPEYADRDLNVGFSGGEKKKAEILQLLMLKPELAILDETDSGLDIDAVKTVSKGVSEFRNSTEGSLLIITHSTRILESIHVDKVHVLIDGVIKAEGDASLIDEINENGFERYITD